MAQNDKDKDKEDEKNGKDAPPIPKLPKSIPDDQIVPKVVEPAPLVKPPPKLTKAERQDKKRKKAIATAEAAKKATEKASDARLDFALAEAKKQREAEEKLMKEAGAPGAIEKLLTYATGGIFGAASGAYSRHSRGLQDVENFRTALKQQRALTGAKTSKTIASLSASGKSDAGNVVNLLGFLRQHRFIQPDGTIATMDGRRSPWWSGLGFDENSTPAMVDARIKRHIKRQEKGKTRTDKLGNEVHDPSSDIFLKGILQRLELHKENYITKQGWDHERAKGLGAARDKFYTDMGANSEGEPDPTNPDFFNTDGSATKNYYLFKGGQLAEDTKLNAEVKKQVMAKGPVAVGEYERLQENFGQFDFDGISWFKELNDMGKVYATSEAFLGRLRDFNKAVEKNIDFFGEGSVVSMEENPFERMMSLKRSIAGVRNRLKEEKDPEEAKDIKNTLKRFVAEYRKANAASTRLQSKVENDNRRYLDAEEDADALAKLKKEIVARDLAKVTQLFKERIVAEDDEGDFVMPGGEFKDKTLYEAMYFDKEGGLKDMFRPFLATDYKTIPAIIDSGDAKAIKLISGQSGALARLYAPKGPFDIKDDKAGVLEIPFHKRNYAYMTGQQKAEMNRVRLAYRKAGADLDFTPELISPNIQTVVGSAEQMAAIATRLKEPGSITVRLHDSGWYDTYRAELDKLIDKIPDGEGGFKPNLATKPDDRKIRQAVAFFLKLWGVHEYEKMEEGDIVKIR